MHVTVSTVALSSRAVPDYTRVRGHWLRLNSGGGLMAPTPPAAQHSGPFGQPAAWQNGEAVPDLLIVSETGIQKL
jgi:hypothetical protein